MSMRGLIEKVVAGGHPILKCAELLPLILGSFILGAHFTVPALTTLLAQSINLDIIAL